MTGEALRDLGYAKWRDFRAWMETMKGARWKCVVDRENKAFQKALQLSSTDFLVEQSLSKFLTVEEEADAYSKLTIARGATKLHILPKSGSYLEWKWEGATPSVKLPPAGDIELFPTGSKNLVLTHDISRGGESYRIYRYKSGQLIWKSKFHCASSLALLGSRIFCLEEVAPLRFPRLISISSETGYDRRTHFEEENPSVALSLIKGSKGCLFLLAENAGHQRLYTVKEDGTVLQQSPRGVSFVLAGYSGSSQDPNYFVRLDSLDAPWTAVGPELSLWSLPPLLKTQGIDYISLSMNLVVIKYRGLRIAYICGHTAYTCIGSFVGELSENPWATWYGQPVADLRYHAPGMMPVRLEAPRVHGFSYKEVPAVYASHLIKTAKSADGTEVGFVYLQNNNQRAKALMVCGYGAYGIPSNLNTTRWKPYLERGWGIAIAFVRGGGDDSPVWADQGRRAGKLKSIEDFEAVIRICQKISHVSPKRTCIYGRSAGGYLVGSTVARHPDGDLFGGAYCEVPYVDVLRTASNPDLPLTAYEYNEFGNPREVLEDFQTLLKLSPVDALTEKGAPGVFVLCRTGTTDRQVYAYESVKWIHALRGNQKGGREKLLFITEGTGHFARGYTLAKEHAEDFLLLQERFLGGQ